MRNILLSITCLLHVLSGFTLLFSIESGWRWPASILFWYLAITVFMFDDRSRSTWHKLFLIPIALLSYILVIVSVTLINEDSIIWAVVVWFIAFGISGMLIHPDDAEIQSSIRSEKPRNARKVREWRELLDRKDVLIVDTETTGLGTDAEVIEIAAIDTCGTIRAHALVLPSGRVPREASDIHGMTKQWLRKQGARDWPTVWNEVKPVLSRAKICLAWNAPFDRRVIKQSCRRHGLVMGLFHWRDLINDYRSIWSESPSKGRHTLKAVTRREGVHIEQSSHRAVGDCRRVLGVLRAVAAKTK